MYLPVQHLEIAKMMLVYLSITPVNTELMQESVLKFKWVKKEKGISYLLSSICRNNIKLFLQLIQVTNIFSLWKLRIHERRRPRPKPVVPGPNQKHVQKDCWE